MTTLPHFSLAASGGRQISDADFTKGKNILYLYPRDATPGCTLEAQDFARLFTNFQDLKIGIFGISTDSIVSHNRFCQNESLPFPLISDPQAELITALGSWKEKTMGNKRYWGTERSTFFIADGKIIQSWTAVSAKGHAEAVLDFCQSFQQ